MLVFYCLLNKLLDNLGIDPDSDESSPSKIPKRFELIHSVTIKSKDQCGLATAKNSKEHLTPRMLKWVLGVHDVLERLAVVHDRARVCSEECSWCL